MLAGDEPIPYAILFGACNFMVFSLFINEDTLGQPRYGLLCSDIISTCSVVSPIIPLAVFTLLGRNRHAELRKGNQKVPPIRDPPVVKNPTSCVTRDQQKHFLAQPKEQQADALLNTVQALPC
jgi:hypothetical protein